MNKDFEDDFDKFEDWECDLNLIEAEDFEGLIKYHKKELARYPDDSDVKWRLGEAYILNKQYDKALDYFSSIYKEEYENPNIQWSILDVLFALGKNENDFEWIEKPNIIDKTKAVEICYEIMKNKRKRRGIDDLYCNIMMKGYPTFKEKDLYTFLINENRFHVQEDECIYVPMVKVVKKKDKI